MTDILIQKIESELNNFKSKLKELELEKYHLVSEINKLNSNIEKCNKRIQTYSSNTKTCKSCEQELPFTDFSLVQKNLLPEDTNYGYRRGSCIKCINWNNLKDKKQYVENLKKEQERLELKKENKKRCSICDEIKLLDDFPNDFAGRVHDNKKSYCKACGQVMRSNYKNSDPEKYRKMKTKSDKKYAKKRAKTDPMFNIMRAIRSSLGQRLKQVRENKTFSYTSTLGCDSEMLKQHLTSLFYNRSDGTKMTLENWGKDGWEVDHHIPMMKFDLSKESEVRKANNYKNLKPMWVEDHRIKSIKEMKEYHSKK